MEETSENNIKKHQAQQLSFNTLQVVLSVGMVAVGASVSNYYILFVFYNIVVVIKPWFKHLYYINYHDLFQYYHDCNMGAALFLCVGGGIMLFVNIFSLFAWATPCEFDDM